MPLHFHLALLAFLAASPLCQAQSITLPSGTPLPVKIERNLPMHTGQPIRAKLIYPVYADNKLVLPANTVVTGEVISLCADRDRRTDALLRADFTPFRTPVVRFTSILLPSGNVLPITTTTASDGAPIYRLLAPPPRKGGFIRRQISNGVQIFRDRLALITAPGKKDRLVQLLYSQLPWHPQRIAKDTAWTVETAAPITIPPQSAVAAAPADPADSSTWIVQAYLSEKISSATSKQGKPIHAVVAEPIYNPDHTIAVPQGATLIGTVTEAKPARLFARAGVLRFHFKQIILPTGQEQNVQSALLGADSNSAANLAMNSEGRIKPRPQDKIVVPFLLAVLTATPLLKLEELGPRPSSFVAANGLGLAGNIVAITKGSPEIATGIGAYGTALSLYNRWIKRGTDVTFARDTRIVIQTTPRHAPVLRPNGSQ